MQRMSGSCLNCRYWVPGADDEDEDGIGCCHRHAPRPSVVREQESTDSGYTVWWPVTLCDEICGDRIEA